MAIKSYGRISITNITQVGELRLQPMSNSPLQIIFNPDTNTCVPDWNSNNLEITPMVFFNGEALASGYTVEFFRQDGMATEAKITATSGTEYVSGGKLYVKNSNVIKNTVSGVLTYKMKVAYTEPKTKITLTAEGNLTFSIVKNAETVKYVSISGDSAFLYNAKQQIQGANNFTLSARTTGVNISKWQYQKADGSWEDYPTTHNADISTANLVVYESDPTFFNDKLVVRVNTTDAGVFDLHTISKIRDGAAGGDSVAMVLSNDSHILPAAYDGTPTTYEGASTEVHMYKGGIEETDKWDITYVVSDPTNVTVAYDQAKGLYYVSRIAKTVDVATVTFTATKTDGTSNPVVSKFTVTKVKSGVDGSDAVIYRLIPSSYVMNKSEAGVLTPDKIIFRAKKRVGTADESNYAGRFYIYETTKYNPSDSDWVKKENSTVDEISHQYTPTATAVAIKCKLLAAGSTDTSKDIDSQTVVITNDGVKGADGESGEGGLSIVLGNEAELITCGNTGLVDGAQTISIPYTVYKGIEKVAATAEISGTLPSGMTLSSITNASASAPGVVTIAVANAATLGGASIMKGEVNIVVTIGEVSDTKKFSWSKNIRAKDGENAVVVQLFAPGGDIIVKSLVGTPNNVVLNSQVVDGSTIVTSGVTYAWKKLGSSGTYETLSGKTGSSLTVTPDMVDTYGFFQCEVTYKSKKYSGYYMVTDRSDPVEVAVFCNLGTQFVNNDKPGVIYAIVTQNGVEVDPLKSYTFSETAPSNPSNGQYYYKIDKTQRTVTLMKYNGSSWIAAPTSDQPTLKYNWYHIDPNSAAVNTSAVWKIGKVIYFDNVDTAPSLNLICEVTD